MFKFTYIAILFLSLTACSQVTSDEQDLDGHWHIASPQNLIVFYDSDAHSYFTVNIQDSTIVWFSNKPGFERWGKINFERKEILGVLYGDNDTIRFDTHGDTLVLNSRNGISFGLRRNCTSLGLEKDFFSTCKISLNLPLNEDPDLSMNYRTAAPFQTLYWGRPKRIKPEDEEVRHFWILHNRKTYETYEFLEGRAMDELSRGNKLGLYFDQKMPLALFLKFVLQLKERELTFQSILIATKQIDDLGKIHFRFKELIIEDLVNRLSEVYTEWSENPKNKALKKEEFYFAFEGDLQAFVKNNYEIEMPKELKMKELIEDEY